MKKVLILQIKGKSYAGVWNVNKLVGEALIDKGYQVHIVSIRNNQIDINLEYDKRMIVKTINEKDEWESCHLNDIVNEFKKFHIVNGLRLFVTKIKHKLGIKKDVKKLHDYIFNYNPDYIIASHYQLLDMIPKSYLCKTIHEQHSSFEDAINHKATKDTFYKYNGKVKYLWLTRKSMENASSCGLLNGSFIYNAVRIRSDKVSDVVNNKKLITIARMSKEKRIDLMVDIVEEIFKDKKYKEWSLEIFGTGPYEDDIKNHIVNKEQIKMMGLTDNPKREFLSSSINLCTSVYEGFSLSILEALECGIPTIAFDFGESTEEEILNDKTGIIAKDKKDYVLKLKELMDNEDKLLELSKNAKEFSNNFKIENIVNEWISLFNEVDKSL